MKATTILAHHGSPGTIHDFDLLIKQLPELNWLPVDRYQKPHTSHPKNYQVIMGYSFGCMAALMDAAESEANAVILIAPYLFPKKQISPIAKIVLGSPIIGDKILHKMAPKAIDKMLEESSYPLEIPSQYASIKRELVKPQVIKSALFEKNYNKAEFEEALSILKQKKMRIIVIRGDRDQTSEGDQQISQLKKYIDFDDQVMRDAGHAIPWTHSLELANILRTIINQNPQSEYPLGYYPEAHVKNNVYAFLEKHLENIPNRPILTWVSPQKLAQWSFNLKDPLPHDSVSVKELDGLVDRIAAGFIKLGIQKGDRAIVFIPMSLQLYAAMFALQKIGAIAVFLDSWARRDQMGKAAHAVEAKIMISLEKAFQYLGQENSIATIPLKIVVGPHEQSYSATLENLMKTPASAPVTAVDREHTALITFTTGSSGTPKGADRGHRFLAAQHYALNRHLPYDQGDVDLPVFPIFSLNNLAAGVTTVIPAIDVGTPNDKDALILIAQIKQTKTTCTTLSPSLLRSLYRFCLQEKIILNDLRRVITGGAPVTNDDVAQMKKVAPNAEILVLYGSTEVEPMTHIEANEMLRERDQQDPEWVDEGVNVGKFDEGLSVRYLKINKENILIKTEDDWAGLMVPEGSVGEIIVAGEHVCQGYYNNKEAFFRAKIRDENGVVWHRTGDLGRIDQEGNLWLVGRVHNAINRDGTYLFPVRAEVTMAKLPFIRHCAFLGMPDSKLGESTWAVFNCKEEPNDEQRKNYSKEIDRILQKNKIIADKIIYHSEIPMDPRHHSKVEYNVLRDQLVKEKN